MKINYKTVQISYLFTCFIGWKKAFDMVWRDALFKSVGKMLKILEYINPDVNYSIISFLMAVLIMYYLVNWVET